MIRVSDDKWSFSSTPSNAYVPTRLIRLFNKQLSNLGCVPLEWFEREYIQCSVEAAERRSPINLNTSFRLQSRWQMKLDVRQSRFVHHHGYQRRVIVARLMISESLAEHEERLWESRFRMTYVRWCSSTRCLLLFSVIGKEESVIHTVLWSNHRSTCVCRCVFERNVSIDGSEQENILIHYLSENIEKVITRTKDDKTVINSVGKKRMPLLSSG